jgi:hypothetical protein
VVRLLYASPVKNVLKGKPKSQNSIVCQNSKCTHCLKKQNNHIGKQGKYHKPATKNTNAYTTKSTLWKPKAHTYTKNTYRTKNNSS